MGHSGQSEFKSPESSGEEFKHQGEQCDLGSEGQCEEQKQEKGSEVSSPTMQFAGCDNFHSEEDLSEKGEFRRSSMDKRQAVEHYDMPPRKTGVVVKFSQQKGYGFIRPDFDYMNGR